MISVILAVYNVEGYIRKSIESVLNQSYKDIQLIIVDDGSNDNTGKICLEYQQKDPRILYIKKKNEGQGVARSMAMKVVQGEYVTFLDGDDWLEEDALEKMHVVAVAENADIVVGDMWYVYQFGDTYEKKYSKIRYFHMQRIARGEHSEKISKLRTFTCGKLFRKDFLIKEKFSQPAFAYEDTATIPLLLLHAENIVYVNTPVYCYLKNRNTSTIYNKEKAADLLNALKVLYVALEKEDGFVYLKREIMRLFWGQIRSLFMAHKVEWNHTYGSHNQYDELIRFMKEKFPEFIILEKEDIRVVNSRLAEEALGCILLSNERVTYMEDDVERTGRIILGKEQKEYVLPPVYNVSEYTEDRIWDCADAMFSLRIGECDANSNYMGD